MEFGWHGRIPFALAFLALTTTVSRQTRSDSIARTLAHETGATLPPAPLTSPALQVPQRLEALEAASNNRNDQDVWLLSRGSSDVPGPPRTGETGSRNQRNPPTAYGQRG
jgi:hypothetical protein